MPETTPSPRPFMLPAWRAAAIAYRAARQVGQNHHQAQTAAHMAIHAHHPSLTHEEASDESVKAIAYPCSFDCGRAIHNGTER